MNWKVYKSVFLFSVLIMFYGCGSSEYMFVVENDEDVETVPDERWELKDDKTFLLTEISEDETYGYTPENPINVGGINQSEGPLNQRRFLNALYSPTGKAIEYYRKGTCCQFETENGTMGKGLLDMYEITWKGEMVPIILYINMYDFGPLKAPKGFGLGK